MSYRDDRDADQARIAALEADLALARRRIDELEGKPQALVPTRNALAVASATGGELPWYGAPTRLERSRTFTGEFPRDHFEDVVDVIRARARDPGRVELLRSSMTWSAGTNPRGAGPFTVITLSIRDGRTTVVATDNLGQLAGGVYGGFGGGVGGGGMMIPIVALHTIPVLIPVGIAAWLGGVFFGARAIYKRAAHRRAEALHELFEAVSAEVAARIARADEA